MNWRMCANLFRAMAAVKTAWRMVIFQIYNV
jgi:hypothetical protein